MDNYDYIYNRIMKIADKIRYLINKGNYKKALKLTRKLYRWYGNLVDEVIEDVAYN